MSRKNEAHEGEILKSESFSIGKIPEVSDDYNLEDEDPDFELSGCDDEQSEKDLEERILREENKEEDCLEDLEVI